MAKYRAQALAVIAAAVLAQATSAEANGKKKKDKEKDKEAEYEAPYGMAGCGLGSIIFRTDKPAQQISAATSNNIGINQSSAISCSHSSNCRPTPIELAEVEQKVFISANMRSLERDAAQGDGTYLRAFAQVLGCEGDDYAALVDLSRTQHSVLFASAEPDQVLAQYLDLVRKDDRLAGRCLRIF